MDTVATKAKLKIDFEKLGVNVAPQIIDRLKFVECQIEWGINNNNSQMKLFLTDQLAYPIFKEIQIPLAKYKGSLKEIFSFSEMENEEIASIYVDKLGNKAQRHLGNLKSKSKGIFFSFNYLEVHWKINPILMYDRNAAHVYFNKAANFLFDKTFYTYSRQNPELDFASLEVKMESSFKSTYLPIGGYDILPAINFHFPKETEEEIIIGKEPFISVLIKEWKEDSLSKLIEYCKILSKLLSSYTNRHIDFLKLTAFYEDKQIMVIRAIPFNYDYNSENRMEYIAKFKEPETFLSAFDFKLINEKYDVFEQLINTKLLAHNSTGITKFMMFFIMIDAVKDQTLSNEQSKGVKFKFKDDVGKEAFGDLLNDFFKKYGALLDASEKDALERKKNSIKQEIMLRTMKDQFAEFFIHAKIDIQKDYKFDFETAKEIRNQVFHGRELSEEQKANMNEMLKYDHLPKLADDLFFGFFGAKSELIRD